MSRVFDDHAAAQLRRAYMTDTVVEQRRVTRQHLAARPGEHLLDLGCGPGHLAAELAEEVGPGGQVTAVDPSEPMRRVATMVADERGVADRITIRDGHTGSIPTGDASLDGAAVVQVLEHVADVPEALMELHRVLRPGGRLLIIDTDWRSCVWHTADTERTEAVLSVWRQRFEHPQLPAELEPLLLEAGFTDVDVVPVPLLERQTPGDSYSLGMLRTITAFVAEQATIGPDMAAAWNQDVLSMADSGRSFFGLTRYLLTARR